LSKRHNCVIIGGGVIGLTIAWRLAKEGRRITLVERSVCGAEASWAGAGILSALDPRRGDSLAQLRDRSLALYPALCAALHAESGIDPEYERCGELELVLSKDAVPAAKSLHRAADCSGDREGPPNFEYLDAQEVARVEPRVSKAIQGAVYCRATAQVRNPRLLQALRASCIKAGVDIREATVARGLATAHNGRVDGVVTDGATIAADRVVLCAGAWSSALDPRLATLMPVHPVRGQMVLLQFDERPFAPVISQGKIYIVPRRDGHVLIGSTEEPEAGFQCRNTAKGIAHLLESAMTLVPSLDGARVMRMWAGLRPGTPDDKPYLGAVPGMDGLIAATGHYRTGLTIAPATAEAIVALLETRSYDIDLTSCRPGRA